MDGWMDGCACRCTCVYIHVSVRSIAYYICGIPLKSLVSSGPTLFIDSWRSIFMSVWRAKAVG